MTAAQATNIKHIIALKMTDRRTQIPTDRQQQQQQLQLEKINQSTEECRRCWVRCSAITNQEHAHVLPRRNARYLFGGEEAERECFFFLPLIRWMKSAHHYLTAYEPCEYSWFVTATEGAAQISLLTGVGAATLLAWLRTSAATSRWWSLATVSWIMWRFGLGAAATAALHSRDEEDVEQEEGVALSMSNLAFRMLALHVSRANTRPSTFNTTATPAYTIITQPRNTRTVSLTNTYRATGRAASASRTRCRHRHLADHCTARPACGTRHRTDSQNKWARARMPTCVAGRFAFPERSCFPPDAHTTEWWCVPDSGPWPSRRPERT